MPALNTSLTLTVPAGWQVVDLDGLLSEAVAETMIAALGDELATEEREGLREAFHVLHEQVEADRIAFMALREDDQSGAREVMTLALPGEAEPPGAPSPSISGGGAGTAAGAPSRSPGSETAQVSEAIRLGEETAIAHFSVPGADGGSWVQLVFFLPGTREGAILTLISSGGDRAEALKEDAATVAGSVGVLEGDGGEG